MEQPINFQLPRSWPCIKIRQQNLNKSLTAQSDMLQLLDPDEYDIAAIQEPYLNHNHNSCASRNWFTLYLKEHYAKPNKTRSLMLINKRIPTNKWTQIDLTLSDMTAIQMQTPLGSIILINMYNDVRNSEGPWKIMQYMINKAQDQNPRWPTHIVWLGDFNAHHPMWKKIETCTCSHKPI